MILVKQQTKTIRPFLNADDLRNAFAATAIRMKSGDPTSTDEAIIIREEDRPLLEPVILPQIDRESVIEVLGKMEIPAADVQVAMIATSHEMRLSETIATYTLDDFPEDEVALRPKITPFLVAKGGFELTISLMLADELIPRPLRPSAYGQWLAKKTFLVRPEQPANNFRILPLGEETRLRLKLPEGTFHFVEKTGSLNDPEAKLENCLTVWVAESIFNSLSRDDASKSSVAVQKMLLASVTQSVVVDEVGSFEPGDLLPEPGSPLDGFFTALSKESGESKEKLVAYAKSNGDKARLGAYIENMLQLNGAIKAAV